MECLESEPLVEDRVFRPVGLKVAGSARPVGLRAKELHEVMADVPPLGLR